ncbi:hypothetical protein SUGI_0451810 [Cryptomeria japonica]|nr:hypothetical protein SUGI_0451810 [Cryptomeria japonica]
MFIAPFLQAAVKKESGGLLWKKLKYTCTRRANTKKRLRRVTQNENVLRACAGPPPEGVTPPPESKKEIMVNESM